MGGVVEVRGVIASKRGLSCEGYYRLSARTGHLRERLYVSVRDGEKLFLPKDPHEHFPVTEIEGYYVERMRFGINESIGAGGGEVLFSCQGPAAEEGAQIINATLIGLEETVDYSLGARWMAAIPEKRQYMKLSGAMPFTPPAYRPAELPYRPAPVEALSEADRRCADSDPRRLQSIGWYFEERKREALARWGLLEDYDRAQRQKLEKGAEAKQSPWTMEHARVHRQRWKEDLWK